ncbi:hypothetical protein BGX21_007925, partial [Mortierella sp. AD011]
MEATEAETEGLDAAKAVASSITLTILATHCPSCLEPNGQSSDTLVFTVPETLTDRQVEHESGISSVLLSGEVDVNTDGADVAEPSNPKDF